MQQKPIVVGFIVLGVAIFAVAAMLMSLGVRLFAFTPAPPVSPRQQVEQKAASIARDLGLSGQPTNIIAISAARQQVGISNICKNGWEILKDFFNPSQTQRNRCNPDATVWLARVQGDFGKDNSSIVWVLMGSDGELIEAGNYEFPGWRKAFPYLWDLSYLGSDE